MDTSLIDRIYECAFLPDYWPVVLRDTSKLSGSAGASLFIIDPDVVAWSASKNFADATERFVTEKWYRRGKLTSRFHDAKHPGFLRDIDVFSESELAEEPIYRDNWRTLGIGWGTATAISLPTGETLSIVLPRTVAQGPADVATIQRLDALRPHLARTSLLAARLRLTRAESATQVLAALGLPALALGETGRVLSANALIERFGDLLHWRSADRITLKDRRADTMLTDALAYLLPGSGRGVRSFPVGDPSSGTVMVGHIVPIRFAARDIFFRSVAVFILTPVSAPGAPPAELIMSLFDLTPAEAQIARGVAAGKTLDMLAKEKGVSMATVRTQVKGVLDKTGCHRQVDAVALLGGIAKIL